MVGRNPMKKEKEIKNQKVSVREGFIGILTDEEARRMKEEISLFKKRFDDDLARRRKNWNEGCQHEWFWYSDKSSTWEWAGYWRCGKCGAFRF